MKAPQNVDHVKVIQTKINRSQSKVKIIEIFTVSDAILVREQTRLKL